jgi:Spy/CpxP family protein refolding chaperone
MNKKLVVRQLAAATALLFTLGVALASAQDGRHGKMGAHGFGMRGLSQLNLTDSQKADVQRIMDSRKATFESLRERARTDWQALHDLSAGSAPDRSAVGAAFLKLQADRDALRAERQSAMQEVRSILTPEQKSTLDTLREQRKERFSRRGMQGGPGR